MIATLMLENGGIISIQPKNGKDFKLEELYHYIQTDIIEVVRSYNPRNKREIMIIDETGKLKHKPLNQLATIWYANEHDVIVGRAIICPDKMLQ
jgi:hypothetical protein